MMHLFSQQQLQVTSMIFHLLMHPVLIFPLGTNKIAINVCQEFLIFQRECFICTMELEEDQLPSDG